MLNGKFYTGLPPQMIDRVNAGGRNRLESHLFWPDDTQVDTALESRLKRRNSIQLACNDTPLYQKHNLTGDNDVDTKKRFTKEFSQSSIQFYDNLNDDTRGSSARSLMLNCVGNKKMQLADKPTNTKLELPDSVVNEAYTASKKNQAYTSKIEFYDYVNDREEVQSNRNNLRKPKMYMNDKREMELNSKNSPKLQMKHDVRSLSEEKEEQKINNRDVNTMEKAICSKAGDFCIEGERFVINEKNYLRSRRSVDREINHVPKRTSPKTINNRERRYSNERDIHREPHKRSQIVYYENFDAMESDRSSPTRHEDFCDNSPCKRRTDEPERTKTDYGQCYDDSYRQAEEVESRMKNVHLRSPSPRRQYYKADDYNADVLQNYYYQNNRVRKPTNRGSAHKHSAYNNRDATETYLPYKNLKITNTNNQPVKKESNQIQQQPVATPLSLSVSATKSQKHLRSSLCFNNGEIIGENDGTRSPTSAQYPTQRRNARSSATQRVSVGLPD